VILNVPAGTTEAVTTNISANLTEVPDYSGKYFDTAVFSTDVYEYISSDEISSNPHLYAIGETVREYVIAEFNDNYSSVRVYKNGAASDGLMRDFTLQDLAGGAYMDLDRVESPLYTRKNNLKTVVVEDGIKNLGENFASMCTSVESVTLPNSIEKIEERALQKTKISSITFPSSLKEIGKKAFEGCAQLTTPLVFPSTLESIGPYAFQSCRAITGVLTLNEGLKHIGDGAFNHCVGISNTTLTIPSTLETIGGDTSYTVTSTSTSEDLSEGPYNFNNSSHVFYNTLRNNTAFTVASGNTYFKAVDGVLFTMDGKRLIAYPVSREGSRYEIPEGVEAIDEMAFGRGVYSSASNPLRTLALPNSYVIKTKNNYANTINRGAMNSLASSLYTHTSVTAIEVKADNPNYTVIDGCLYSKDETTLWYVPTAKSGVVTIQDGTTTIEYGAFSGFQPLGEHVNPSNKPGTNVTQVIVPASVSTIYDTDFDSLKKYAQKGGIITIDAGNELIRMDGTTLVALKTINAK